MRTISYISGDYQSILDETNRNVINSQIFLFAQSGEGKGMAMEGIAEEFHKKGYVIIAVADPKRKWELAFQMFKPKEAWHLNHLRKIGKTPNAKLVKLYHPYTHAIPSGYLPQINFFTLSLKQLKGKEWNFIAETEQEIETIKILKQTTKNISREDGLYSFLHQIEELILGKMEGKSRKRDWNNFGLKVGSGKSTSLSDISNYLQPFKEHYFLTKDSCKYNLDIRTMLKDREHYHIFSAKWISDEKVRDFVTLSLIESVINEISLRPTPYPILFLIPELNHLCKDVKIGYKSILNEFMNDKFGMFRGQGKGISSVSDSQVWSDISPQVRDKATVTFFGKIGGGTDLDRIKKSYSYQRAIVEELKNPEDRNTFLRSDINEVSPILIWFSSSAHAEPRDDFLERYKKEHKKLVRYEKLIKEIKNLAKEDELNIRNKVKEQAKEEAKIKLKEKLEKESKSEDNLESQKQKIQKKVDTTKEKIMKLAYDLRNDNKINKKDRSWRKISEKLGIDHKTAIKYAEDYEKVLEQEESQDFEDKALKELEGGEEHGGLDKTS